MKGCIIEQRFDLSYLKLALSQLVLYHKSYLFLCVVSSSPKYYSPWCVIPEWRSRQRYVTKEMYDKIFPQGARKVKNAVNLGHPMGMGFLLGILQVTLENDQKRADNGSVWKKDTLARNKGSSSIRNQSLEGNWELCAASTAGPTYNLT